jgi:hypothetical protein
MGGWDYFMFQHRQAITKEVSKQVTVKPLLQNTDTATGTEFAIDKSSTEKIKVGADMVGEDDFVSLNDLPLSNKIQYYDTVTRRWFNLLIDKGATEQINGNTAQSVEFTFIMPEPQTP